MNKQFSKKDMVASSIIKTEDLIANLKELTNSDYHYDSDIQNLSDLLEHLNCRYKYYVEKDEEN